MYCKFNNDNKSELIEKALEYAISIMFYLLKGSKMCRRKRQVKNTGSFIEVKMVGIYYA